MYNHNRNAQARSDSRFLRRMNGGFQTGVPSFAPTDLPDIPTDAGMTPAVTIPAPSLAMVYSPKQGWKGIYAPAEGLASGSIFEELILPLEAAPTGSEVRR